MMEIIATNLYGWIAGAGILLMGVWKIYNTGKKNEQAKRAKQEVEAVEEAKQIERDVQRSTADERRSELFGDGD